MKIVWTIAAVMVTVITAMAQSDSKSRSIDSAIPLGADTQIKKFKVPTYADDGTMTSQIFGEAAMVLPNGDIEITELKMEFYSNEGASAESDDRKTDMTVTSPQCFYNRAKGVVVSDSDVRISRNELVVTGKGFTWNNDKQELKILNDSKVVLRGARKNIKPEEEKRD